MGLNGPLIKVEDVPCNATKRDLHILFSSVAQINWIHLNRHKKSAILSLYDKSSTEFVLQKEWTYDESTLRLSKVGKDRKERTFKEAGCHKLDKPPFFSSSFIQAPKLSLLQEYHQGKSKFWVDVPHEKAVPVKTAFRYKKRKSAGTGAKIVPVKHKKKQPRRRKQKLKIPKLNMEMSYEQFLEEIKYFSQVQHDERHSIVRQIKENEDPSELENKGATAPSRMKIQLIFKARSTFTLDIHDRLNVSLESIRCFVQRKDKIRADMQLLLYEGHVLQEDHLRHLKNGDCIHVLCRGMGGMQCGSSDGKGKDDSTCPLTITNKSSEDEVQKWLMDVIHVPSEYKDKFDFVDGKSICACQDYTDLSSILSIPIGLARKVLYMRSQESWCTDIDITEIRTWSIDDLADHLKNVKYKQLKEMLQDKCIDGLTFLTYSYSAKEELKRDLGLQGGGLHLRLWTESQNLKDSLTQSKTKFQKTDTSECMPDESGANYLLVSSHQSNRNGQQVQNDEQNEHAKIPFQNEKNQDSFVDRAGATESCLENMKQSISGAESPLEIEKKSDVSLSDIYQVLEEKFGLCRLERVTKELRELTLISIGSPNKLSTQNFLEKTFLFTVLFEKSKISNVKQYLNFLWKKIIENTSKWVEYLPPGSRRDKFKNAKGGGTPAFNVDGKKVKMSSVNKRHYLKQLENDIGKYQHFFLLVDDSILEDSFLPESGYKVYLGELCSDEYGFCFNSKVKYLTFNSRDSFGEFTEFMEKHTRQKDLGAALFSQAKNDLHMMNQNEKSNSDKEKAEEEQIVDQRQVNVSIKSDATQPEASDQLNEEISEDTVTELTSHQDSTIQNFTSNCIINISDKRQNRRHFKAEGSSTMYHKDWVLDRQETGSGMMIPSVEFKYFSTIFQHGDKNEPIKKFIFETLRFACGCLNRRRNGTIYFGVADGGVPIEGMKYRDGQIVGFPIDDLDHCTKKKYIDELDHAKVRYIEHADAKRAAKECIRSPEFIEVTSRTGLNLFVMEVDIEPSILFCKRIPFYLNLKDFQKETGRKTKGKIPLSLFVRDGSMTLSVSADDEKYELKELYEKYDIVRESEELNAVKHIPLLEKKAEKLYRKICMGLQALDKSLWPILVLTKPDDMKMNNLAWLDDFKFLKSRHWVCVFDFNDHSYESGILGQIFPKGKTTVTNEEKFRYVENVVQLRDELQAPEKVVWIFANGRKELGKAHKDRKEWIDEYSSGIKGAVQFFHQRSVIPEKRAIIILFLLSDDFAGVVETLFELVSHFSWKQIVIIADKQETFDKFKHVVESERNFYQEDLEGSSVVGLSWKEVSSVFEEAMGIEIESDCKVPSSSGAMMTVDSRFLEQLKDLKILSATKYENVKFQKDEKKSFSHEKEKKFYQGNRVDWWNFYFETHVLKRLCFNSLQQKVKTALTSPRNDYQNIITITIIHEPGAGGSTLANHILWDFRKDFKCATLERLTENTCNEIFELWKMFESDLRYAKPVLILVDDLFQADISLNELYRKTHFMYREKNMGMMRALPVCVLLQCRKEDDFSKLHLHEKINEDVTILLRQKLEEKGPINEKEWCENKYLEFEKTGHELGLGKYAPEHLIAFMILRSGFNIEFIKNTLDSMLKNIDPESKEFKLLKYMSLLFSYVESHEAIDIHIPLECCDQLMSDSNILKGQSHKDYPWEYSLHEPVKILLRIEDKQEGSGRQIKMAHQNLASRVLECIKNKTKQSTASIALEYLKSDLLNNYSYAKAVIQEMTKEMLIRRKKEEYSDCKTTTFSPLVEDMLKESSYQDIADVLSLGYDQLKDGMIAHQIARVYIHVKDFENAKKWADTALSTAPHRSDFIHTCGLIMKKKFSHLLTETNSQTLSLSNQILLIKIAFQAVDIFREATSLIMRKKAANNLFIYVDTIDTILKLLDFVGKNIKPFNTESVLHNYLMSPDFIPDELSEKWIPFHEKFKALYETGESAFRHIEDLIFCHTTFYERKDLHTKERKEHISNRYVKCRLPRMQTNFSNIFGEKEECIKEIYKTDSDMSNNWYRGRLLHMKANSFIKIFDNFALIKMKKLSAHEAIQKLKKTKNYLHNISLLTDCDLANKISVNVALAHLKASDRESTQSVFAFCKELLNLNRKFLDVACFFIIIILWPNKDDLDGVEYDENLFHKALQTLGELFNTRKEQILGSKTEAVKFKQEHNVFRATTQFFLTHGKGLRSICHRSELFLKDNADSAWESPPPPHLNLLLLEGVSSSSSKGNFIIVLNKIFSQGKTIKIRNSYRRTKFVSEEQVSFYLGFSFEGLVAYGVKPISGSNINSWRFVNYIDYNEVPKDQLLEKICKMDKIKAKIKNNVPLYPDEQQLLQDEVEIRDALSQYFEEDTD